MSEIDSNNTPLSASQSTPRSNLKVALASATLALGMVGVSYAAVPLYRLFCQITGYGGTTQVAEEALNAGFEVSGFTTQAYFLLSLGLTECLAESQSDDIKQQMLVAQQVKKLTMPNEMGELFKVIALQKNLSLSLQGFTMNDQRGRL